MSTSKASTIAEQHSDTEHEHEVEERGMDLNLQRKVSQAAAEGHDADIPSREGYVLDERGELKRLQSISKQRRSRASIAWRQSYPNAILGNDIEKGAKERDDPERDLGSVSWDGPDDPLNPYNWPSWRKAMNVAFISIMTFITPLASSIFAPVVPSVMKEFHSDNLAISSFVVSVYVLGFAAGPIVIAPLSEIYGRVPIYHGATLGFTLFAIACALAPSLNSLIAFRFLCGIFGSAPLTNGGGTIADIYPQEKRGTALSLFSVGPLFGPVIGPIAGGFLGSAEGWRWTFWLLAIIGGFLFLVMLVCLRETYAPVLLARKTARLQKEMGNPLLRSSLDVGLSPSDYFKRGLIRPLKMLASPIVLIVALYTAVCYGYLYLLFTTVSELFITVYGFSNNIAGLAFLGVGVGSLLGITFFSWFSDRSLKSQSGGGEMKPEYRLTLLPIGSALLPAGLFIYGWSAQYHVHFIVPLIGTAIFGIGNLLFFLCIQTYLVDCFTLYAASALATNTLIRSIAGAVLPLAGPAMYAALGYGWGNSLLAFIAIALLPVAIGIRVKGEWLRKKFPIKNM